MTCNSARAFFEAYRCLDSISWGLSARTPTIAVMVLFMVVTVYLPHFSLGVAFSHTEPPVLSSTNVD
jgi:hypothetical protein